MPVEVREILIKTEINAQPANGGALSAEQLAQLKKELLQHTRRERDKSQRNGFNR